MSINHETFVAKSIWHTVPLRPTGFVLLTAAQTHWRRHQHQHYKQFHFVHFHFPGLSGRLGAFYSHFEGVTVNHYDPTLIGLNITASF